MSYQVLARKWRPQKFTDVVGQEHVLTALANGLEMGRVHHAYLFSGTRGVGKTTIARLIAKGLNCETGVTAKPCGECVNCREIEQGRFVDLLEIDAASRTKVEDTRELLDNVQYAPVRGRFKVYLIDEVHMLSRHSFNALLKTLEEPPEHVKFLLATTDPQKLPITILSRCLQFNLRALDIPQISHQLEKVLTQESVEFEPKALQLLARAAQGSMRDALSLTDQAIASGNNQVIATNVSQMLGMLDDAQAINIVEAIINGEPEKVFHEIEMIRVRGSAWLEVLIEVSALLHQISLLQMLPKAIAGHYLHHEEKLRNLARVVTPADLQIYYQIMLIGRKELPYAPDAQMGVEMTLIRALAFHPQQQTQYASAPIKSVSVNDSSTKASSINSNLVDESALHAKSSAVDVSNNRSNLPQNSSLSGQAYPGSVQHVQASAPIQQERKERLAVEPVVVEPIVEKTVVAKSVDSTTPVSPPISNQTNALLQARQRLREKQEENTAKKSEPAEQRVRPVISAKPNQVEKQLFEINSPLSGSASAKTQAASNETTVTDQFDPLENAVDEIDQSLSALSEAQLVEANLSVELDELDEEDALNYQWRTQNQAEEIIAMATPKQLRQAIEQDKTPEVLAKMAKIACERDEWARMIPQLALPKLTEQLALNSIYQQATITDNKLAITLRYRSSQKHLVNQASYSRLSEALSTYLGCEIALELTQDDNNEGLTPYELRLQVYAELLESAKHSVFNDPKLQKICSVFDAKIDETSIKPA